MIYKLESTFVSKWWGTNILKISKFISLHLFSRPRIENQSGQTFAYVFIFPYIFFFHVYFLFPHFSFLPVYYDITFAVGTGECSSSSASSVGTALMQRTKFHIKRAVHDFELETKGKLDFISREQTSFRVDIKMTTDDFADVVIALENKIDHPKRSHASSCFEPKMSEGFANDLGTL